MWHRQSVYHWLTLINGDDPLPLGDNSRGRAAQGARIARALVTPNMSFPVTLTSLALIPWAEWLRKLFLPSGSWFWLDLAVLSGLYPLTWLLRLKVLFFYSWSLSPFSWIHSVLNKNICVCEKKSSKSKENDRQCIGLHWHADWIVYGSVQL